MKTNPEALKDLYIALGGEEAVVADKAQTVDVLNALAAKYEGEADATLIPDAIDNITAVADNISGVKPSGTIDLETNGLHDVTNYESANVNVPASAVVSGTTDIVQNGTVDVTNFAKANVNVPASAVVSGTKTITTNGTTDVTNYANVNVNVAGIELGEITVNNNTAHGLTFYAMNEEKRITNISIAANGTNSFYVPLWYGAGKYYISRQFMEFSVLNGTVTEKLTATCSNATVEIIDYPFAADAGTNGANRLLYVDSTAKRQKTITINIDLASA